MIELESNLALSYFSYFLSLKQLKNFKLNLYLFFQPCKNYLLVTPSMLGVVFSRSEINDENLIMESERKRCWPK